jgi:hypothetical protein
MRYVKALAFKHPTLESKMINKLVQGRTRCILSDLGRAIRPLMLPDDQLRSFRLVLVSYLEKSTYVNLGGR